MASKHLDPKGEMPGCLKQQAASLAGSCSLLWANHGSPAEPAWQWKSCIPEADQEELALDLFQVAVMGG